MDFDDEFDDSPPNSPDEMAIWLSEFMTAADSAAEVYRNHVVTPLLTRFIPTSVMKVSAN